MTELNGSVAVVTGAGSGIGRACVLEFARRGARVVVVDLNAEGAQATTDAVLAEKGEAVTVVGDVTDPATYETILDTANRDFGGVDIVMNNAGVITRGLPEHIPLEEWRNIFEVNLFSVVHSNAVFVPYFVERGRGHIVNTGSFAGLYTFSYDRLPYTAAKAGIVQLSEGLRLYLEPRGVSVTLLCPGPIRTGISSRMQTWGPETVTRGPGPEFPFLEPSTVAQQVSEGIEAGTFFLPTHPNVTQQLIERAQDWDGYLGRQDIAIAQSPEA